MVKRDLITYVGILLVLVLGVFALRIWFLEPVTINRQMANKYLKENDLVIAVKNSELDYGDFVVYTVDDKEYAGRIIAQPGDSVTYMDDVLYRNDEIVPETYLSASSPQEYYTEDMTIATLTDAAHAAVPKAFYLILNDNRTDKRDSRTFGLISQKQIIGRLSFRISPLNKFGFIENGLVQ